MQPYVPVLVNVLLAMVTGIATAMIALWRAQHRHELDVQRQLAEIRQGFVPNDRMERIVGDIKAEIHFIRGLLIPIARRLHIPAVSEDDDPRL